MPYKPITNYFFNWNATPGPKKFKVEYTDVFGQKRTTLFHRLESAKALLQYVPGIVKVIHTGQIVFTSTKSVWKLREI